MSKLREARELLQGGVRLTAGEYEMGGCFCSVGALREAHGFNPRGGGMGDMVAYRDDVQRLACAVRASEGAAPPSGSWPASTLVTVTEWNDAQFEADGWNEDMDAPPTDPGDFLDAKEKILAVWDAAIAGLDQEEAKA